MTSFAPAKIKFVPSMLLATSGSHLLNDLLQSLLPAIFPILKANLGLTFGEVGLIMLVFQLTASVLQPVVGLYTDKHPAPFSASIGMISSLLGLILLSFANSLPLILVSAALVGVGSAIFHPESSRMARAASGGRFGLAQSLFQVGGNSGSAIGPLLAALIIVPFGQRAVLGFIVVPLAAMTVLFFVGRWYQAHLHEISLRPKAKNAAISAFSRGTIIRAVLILLALIFSKFFYLAALNTFYTFYLIQKFQVSVADAQISLFIFLVAVAFGTFIGGPIGDRYGRRLVMWVSILGALPLTLALPHANLFWTQAISVGIGLILASAFSTIIVYAQELVPGRVGMISGLFFGFAFGMGGLGAGVLGVLADATSVDFVFRVCAFLPALGLLTYFLPRIDRAH